MLRLLNLPDLLVHGPPPSSSPWDLLPDDPQSNQSVALAFDDHMLAVLLDVFKAPEPRVKLVEQTSLFKVPQAIYPRFFKAPPLDEQVLSTSTPKGTTPNSAVIEHRKVVEALYEAFMGVFRTNWHASVLVCYLFLTAPDSCGRNTACYLYRALVEQRTLCLTGTSSALGLIRRQTIETSSLGNWIPLRSRLAPIPFKGGRLFADEILQQADSLDKEQEQLKKARSFGGPFRGFFRSRPRGGGRFQTLCPNVYGDVSDTVSTFKGWPGRPFPLAFT